METYIDPNVLKVMEMEKKYQDWFRTDQSWQEGMEKDILTASDGKIRAFHIFFNSPSECLSGTFRAQALMEQDVINMYPKLYTTAQHVKKGQFLYIFHCNDGFQHGQALSVNTIL